MSTETEKKTFRDAYRRSAELRKAVKEIIDDRDRRRGRYRLKGRDHRGRIPGLVNVLSHDDSYHSWTTVLIFDGPDVEKVKAVASEYIDLDGYDPAACAAHSPTGYTIHEPARIFTLRDAEGNVARVVIVQHSCIDC